MLTACVSACEPSGSEPPDSGTGSPSYAEGVASGSAVLGVVRSSHSSESAFIEAFDGALESLGRTELPYAGLENAWGVPVVSEGVLYLVVQGLEGKRDARLVIGFDLATGETREYPVDLPALKSVAATERFLFVTNSINNSSTITRVDKQSAQTVAKEFSGDFLVGITVWEQQLVVIRQVGFDFNSDAELLILDEEMEVLSVVPLEGFGRVNQVSLVGDGLLGFGGFWEDASSPSQYRNVLGSYSLVSGELRTLADSNYHYGFATSIEGLLIALQSEVNLSEGNRILVYDPQTGDLLSQVRLDFMPKYLLARDGLLYVAGFDQAANNYRLQVYRMEGGGADAADGKLVLITETVLDSTGLPSDRYGVSGLYVLP